MGYTTTFKGTLRFATEPTAPQLAFINAICGADCRDHPEWDAGDLSYVDLAITKGFDGLAWDGSEKTYDLTEKVNLLTRLVRAEWPDFALRGELEAQGEDAKDAWVLRVDEDGIAHRMVTPLPADLVQCPECGHGFRTGQSTRSAPPMSAHEDGGAAMRAAFEKHISNDGEWPQAVVKDEDGHYRLMMAASAWNTWQAAWIAARTPGETA